MRATAPLQAAPSEALAQQQQQQQQSQPTGSSTLPAPSTPRTPQRAPNSGSFESPLAAAARAAAQSATAEVVERLQAQESEARAKFESVQREFDTFRKEQLQIERCSFLFKKKFYVFYHVYNHFFLRALSCPVLGLYNEL